MYEYFNAHSVKRIAVCLCVSLRLLCFSGMAAGFTNMAAPPTLNSSLNPPGICSGVVLNYVPTSSSASVGFSWTRAAVPGISNPAASGIGGISETLINTTGSPITVAYQYTLTSGALTNTQTVSVVVNPLPQASFTINSSKECLTGNSFVFTNTSTIGSGTITKYLWNYGDTSLFTQTNAPHTYKNAGTFTIYLIAVSNLGCAEQTDKSVLVNAEPVADFTYSLQPPSTANTYNFNNTSVDGAAAITGSVWDFGDATTSTTTSPTHTYASAPNYNVSLTVTDANGCSASDTEKLATPTIPPTGQAGFAVGSSPGGSGSAGLCLGSPFYFTDQSTAPTAATITGATWDYGDGSPLGTGVTATHNYTVPGTYIVAEAVQFSNATTAKVTQSINVYPQVTLALDPATPQALCPGVNSTPVYFNPGNDGLQFSWAISNTAVGIVNGSGANFPAFVATNTTTSPISTNVLVTAKSPYGCSVTPQTILITVKPQPSINGPLTPQVNCSGTMINIPAFTGPLAGTTFSWDNSDPVTGLGATGSGSIAPFTGINYTAGPATSYITVFPRLNGCTGATQVVTYTIYPTPALSSPPTDSLICSGTVFQYAPATITTGTSFAWTRAAEAGIQQPAASGSNGISETLTNQTTATIAVPYQYKLSTNICANTQTVNVRVLPTPVLSGTLTPPGLCNGAPFTYTPASATVGTTYAWTRAAVNGISNPAASGNTPINETLQSTVFTPVPVTYQYTLADSGCTNTQDVVVTINPVPTIALPSPATQNTCAGTSTAPLDFTVNPPGTPVNWTNTNPGIGISATGTGDINSFVATNTGTTPITGGIQGTAQTAAGCTSTPSPDYVFTVNPVPTPAIDTPSGTLLCLGQSVPLNASGGNTYQWLLNGTALAGATSPNLAAEAPGNYTVAAFNTQACSDTAQVAVTYIPKPAASFTYNKSCLDTPIVFTNTSTETGGIPVTYGWSDNDGNGSTAASPTFIYSKSGTWSVSLVVTPEGCTTLADTAIQSIDITRPLPGLRLPTEFIESGAPTQVNARSFAGAGYLWDPATGLSNPISADPMATLAAAQEYNIVMTFLSGCVTTDTLKVNVIPKDVIYIPNAFTPNGDGKNDLFVIAGIVSYPGSSLAVYDRWGKQVYFASSYENNWGGGNLQNGTYIYVLELKIPDGPVRIKKGFVEIIR